MVQLERCCLFTSLQSPWQLFLSAEVQRNTSDHRQTTQHCHDAAAQQKKRWEQGAPLLGKLLPTAKLGEHRTALVPAPGLTGDLRFELWGARGSEGQGYEGVGRTAVKLLEIIN